MTTKKRPEWIESAAQAVTELYEHRQEDLLNANESIERGKDQIQEGAYRVKDFPKSEIRQSREEIAQIIHRHFQGQS